MTDNYIQSRIIDGDAALQLAKAEAVASLHTNDSTKPGYFIQTFGCQQNEADSERLGGLCVMMGYRPVSTPAEAKLILVNTCAVREHAEKKALSIIGQYKHIKDADPSVIIGVGGCMVTQQSRADKLKMSYPYVSFTFDTGAIHTVPTLVYEALTGGKRRFILSDEWKITEGLPIARTSKHQAWLSIMYGCNNFCSYCIVPYVRGRERSRKVSDILEEAKQLIAGGAKDITLLGQNVNSYNGGDGCDIAELMHKICALDGDFRLRFMTSHPKDASDRLIEAMATEEKIVKHFHLPVQSGSDRILHEMNRKYTRDSYLEKIAKLKAAVPDVSITSDIIVGFPGETEEDFEEKVLIDVPMPMEYASLAFVEELDRLEPFGNGNAKPLFAQKQVSFVKGKILGQNRNVAKYTVADENGKVYEMIYFGDIEALNNYMRQKFGEASVDSLYYGTCRDIQMSVAYYPDVNEFRGNVSIQMVMRHYQ